MRFNNSRDVIQRWLDAVNHHRLDDVLSLYAPQARLLPTFSPHTLKTDESRHGYFHLLATRQGMEVSLHEKTVHVEPVAPGIEIANGIYRFQFPIDDEPLVFEARFSFLIDLNKPAPILHHHSSQIPRTLS
jgi:hypothetical protein